MDSHTLSPLLPSPPPPELAPHQVSFTEMKGRGASVHPVSCGLRWHVCCIKAVGLSPNLGLDAHKLRDFKAFNLV